MFRRVRQVAALRAKCAVYDCIAEILKSVMAARRNRICSNNYNTTDDCNVYYWPA